jgi:hypothetical protein
MDEFRDCCRRLGARGIVFVDYRREAFVAPAGSLRVTVDRHLVARAYDPKSGLRPAGDSLPPVSRGVVLELKYNGRAPRWMHDLVTNFNLQRTSFPKYVHCVGALQRLNGQKTLTGVPG